MRAEEPAAPRWPAPWLPVFVCLAVCLATSLSAGCASWNTTVKNLGKSATQGVGEELPRLKQPIREILRDSLLSDDTLEQASRRLTQGAMKTLQSEIGDEELHKRVDGLVADVMTVLGNKGSEAVQQVVRTAGPELRQALRDAIVEMLSAARVVLKDAIQKDLTEASQVLAKSLAETLAAALTKQLEGPLGKQLESTAGQLGQKLAGEATAALGSPASKAAVGEFTESAMRGAVRGARDGVNDGLPNRIQVGLIAAVVVLFCVLVLLSLGSFILFRRYRHSTKALTIIAEKINQHDAAELKRSIAKSAQDNYVGPWLSTFLKSRGL